MTKGKPSNFSRRENEAPRNIRAVILDHGNVLSLPQDTATVHAMASICGLAVPRFAHLYSRLRTEYDRGDFDGTEYWAKIANAARITLATGTIEDLIKLDIRSWSRTNGVLLAWLESLREAGIQLALLSNMPLEERAHFSRIFPWFDKFDQLSISCDVRSVKPEIAIFRHCLEGLSARPGEVLFVDDLAANIESGTKLGMHCIRFESNSSLADALHRFALPSLIV